MTPDALETLFKHMTDEELEQAYANNTTVDGYKCTLIRAEQKRRREATTIPDATGFSLEEGIKTQGF